MRPLVQDAPDTQACNPPDEPIDRELPPPFVKIIGPQFTVPFMAGEHGKDTPHDGVRHSKDGPLLPTADGEALREGRERRVLGPHGSMGELGQDRPEGRLPLRVLPERCVPALASVPGATPAQAARRGAVSKRDISIPISATITSAPR